jgi:hypothetical protein
MSNAQSMTTQHPSPTSVTGLHVHWVDHLTMARRKFGRQAPSRNVTGHPSRPPHAGIPKRPRGGIQTAKICMTPACLAFLQATKHALYVFLNTTCTCMLHIISHMPLYIHIKNLASLASDQFKA